MGGEGLEGPLQAGKGMALEHGHGKPSTADLVHALTCTISALAAPPCR